MGKKIMKEIDWKNLSFGYIKTDYNVRCYYRDGKWGEVEVCSEETIPLHMVKPLIKKWLFLFNFGPQFRYIIE